MSKTCPICDAPNEEQYRPFCSKRCADVDLGRWMSGRYAIPTAEEDAPDDDILAAADRHSPPEPR